jgi:hypothetical protein
VGRHLWIFSIWIFSQTKSVPVLFFKALRAQGNENPIYVFLFWKLRGLSPNVHIHVSVSVLYIFPGSVHIFSCSRIGRSIMGIYKSLADTWMWKLGLWPCNSFSGDICFEFSVFCLCSACYYMYLETCRLLLVGNIQDAEIFTMWPCYDKCHLIFLHYFFKRETTELFTSVTVAFRQFSQKIYFFHDFLSLIFVENTMWNIIFSEIEDFNSISSRLLPMELISVLNVIYKTFDSKIDKFQVRASKENITHIDDNTKILLLTKYLR